MKNLLSNRKAISGPLALLIIVIIAAVVIAAAFMLGGSPETASNGDITVYIDTVQQTGNYTQPQTLSWGTISAGNTYTKNFTVANTGLNPYNIMLLTTEPAGSTQTWPFNNTALAASTSSQGTLTLTLSTVPQAGICTWRLLATNSSIPEVTPTPNPSSSPTPNSLSFTISADMGIQSINITKNSGTPFVLMPDQMPKNYLFTSGDTLRFVAVLNEGYSFNGWELGDGSMPINTISILKPSITANFTVTATTILIPQS